jgi:hypothetical protein
MSAGCGFRKETIVEMRRNGRDAPQAVILCDLAATRGFTARRASETAQN